MVFYAPVQSEYLNLKVSEESVGHYTMQIAQTMVICCVVVRVFFFLFSFLLNHESLCRSRDIAK